MSPTNEDSAYERLRAEILSLDRAPGERLSERTLEAALGTSRTPIRAALTRLVAEGLVRKEVRGWQITPIDVDEMRAVMEYREAIETAVVRLAAERADPEDLADLRAIALAHRDDDDEESGLRDGTDFHVALARLSGNGFLVQDVSAAMTRLFRTRWLEVRTPASRAQARAEHVAIVDALAARDGAAAAALVAAHGRGVAERVLGVLGGERRRLRGHGVEVVGALRPPSRPAP